LGDAVLNTLESFVLHTEGLGVDSGFDRFILGLKSVVEQPVMLSKLFVLLLEFEDALLKEREFLSF
jgi:hypothetical protein